MKTKELRTNLWKSNQGNKPMFNYDETLDTLFIYFSEKETDRIVTHFVDEFVAFLYRNSDKEIIGMRIEYFKEIFLKQITKDNGWNLSKTGEELEGFKDLLFKAIEIKKVLTQPLVPSTEQFTIPNLRQKLRLEPVYA